MIDFIYLASQSPRRSQLLDQIGVRHELLLPGDDEDSESLEVILKNEAPSSYVKRVTQLKLDAALLRLKKRDLANAPIICSDTTVALGRSVMASRKMRTTQRACWPIWLAKLTGFSPLLPSAHRASVCRR